MLAVQRNGMGSSKPPDPDMPFGYSFGTDTNFPFPSPVDPAPGEPLLRENDHKYLEHFFDGVDANQLDFDFFMNNPPDPFMTQAWQQDLPPTFMGTTSSFGQQPAQSQQQQHHPPVTSSTHDMNYRAQDMSYKAQDVNFNDMNGHMGIRDELPSTTSPDVVLAAATLLNNGQNGRSHSMNSDAMFGMARDNRMANGHHMHSSSFSLPRSRSMHGNRPSSHEPYARDSFYADLVFGETAPANIAAADDVLRPPKTNKIDIRWGSDSGFGTEQGFVPPADQETAEEVEREHIHRINELTKKLTPMNTTDMTSSNESTRVPSPQTKKSLGRIQIEDEDSRSRKRRKSRHAEEEEEEDPPSSATVRQTGKKRKSVGKPSSSPAPAESSLRRRKSTAASNAAAAKAARENLTEDQKRENHIKSEQKRRTLIREGFEDLGDLVPELRGGGFSKSAVLIMAADWLEDLLRGNALLKERVEKLERGG